MNKNRWKFCYEPANDIFTFVVIHEEQINLEAMDYKTLLIKYMQHLHNMEETLFLELANSPFSPKVIFTEEEMERLKDIETAILEKTTA